jgi:hypothetical protein
LTDRAGQDIDATDPEQSFLPGLRLDFFFDYSFIPSEELTTDAEVVFSVSVGQQAEVPYPDKASGQDMEEEPADKLLGLEHHGLLAIMVRIISPEEGNLTVPDGEEAVIADGDSVGISTQVLQDPLGASEGRFAIDDPFFMVEWPPEGFEVSALERTEAAGKDDLPALEGRSRNLPLNKDDRTLTGRKNPLRQDTQRPPSADRPPPVTMQWRWGWSMRF